MPQYIAAEFCS